MKGRVQPISSRLFHTPSSFFISKEEVRVGFFTLARKKSVSFRITGIPHAIFVA